MVLPFKTNLHYINTGGGSTVDTSLILKYEGKSKVMRTLAERTDKFLTTRVCGGEDLL